MMIKIYCDCCGSKIDESNSFIDKPRNRLSATVKAKTGSRCMNVEVITGLDGVSNAGDFCKYCVIDAITSIDDRTSFTANG